MQELFFVTTNTWTEEEKNSAASEAGSRDLSIHSSALQPLGDQHTGLERRLSVPDFVSQLTAFSRAAKQNPEWKAWVRGYQHPQCGCTYKNINIP